MILLCYKLYWVYLKSAPHRTLTLRVMVSVRVSISVSVLHNNS